MSQGKELTAAVKKLAWGYLLIYLHFNLGTVDILPDWLGYGLMLSAIPVIGQTQKSLLLLRPLAGILTAWRVLLWGLAVFGGSLSAPVVTTVLTAVDLYFHFQLLTDLAEVAKVHGSQRHRRLLTLRTVQTVLRTLICLPVPWEQLEWLYLAVSILGVGTAFWTCAVLFGLRRDLEETHAAE